MDELPLPDRGMLGKGYYDILSRGKRFSLIITSRGCPFRCRFCSASAYGRYRERSIGNVKEELESLKNGGFDDILFFDDMFTANKERLKAICSTLRSLGISWRCMSRVDTVDRETLEMMKASGCYQILFGVESGSSSMLKRMRKGITKDSVRRTFRDCEKLGIETVAFFIIGYPGENRVTVEETISFCDELMPDFVTFQRFVSVPGSEAYESIKKGDLRMTMSNREADEAVSEAYRRYYIRPRYVLARARRMGGFWDYIRFITQNIRFWVYRRGTLWESLRR
ncbi:MAG: hypothetical protein DRO99_04200 [Candidatus Aenigmatarchaeota archaeon]|nr:MAG: hypothetical protein DRO99_04200 [Candidatus Aenigmarchaeota archaeon]